MESWCLSKHKSSLFIFMMLLVLMVGWIQGSYIEDERKALLKIKASLHELSNHSNVASLLPTWVDTGGKHCDWERITCDPTSGYVADLSLGNMFPIQDGNYQDDDWTPPARRMVWPLNISLFLHFKELRTLDLSWSYIGNTFMSSGLERLSGLKKLENLNLSFNYIETNIFPSLSELTSLKILDLTYISLYQGASYDISEFQVLEHLEVLNLTGCGCYGTLQMQGSTIASTLTKLKILSLGFNKFNGSLVTSLSKLSSLETLDLQRNLLSGSFPSEDLSKLSNLKKLDLSNNELSITPSIRDCKSLMRLERLKSVSLGFNKFNKSIISCLSFVPSLNILDLRGSYEFGSSFPMQELSSLRELKTLDLSNCGINVFLNGTIMRNLLHLDLGNNEFFSVDDITRSMAAFPSLRFLSLEDCFSLGFSEEGRVFPNEVPDLPYLEVLILRFNNFNGMLPIEALASLHHLEVLDFEGNSFVGNIPSTIKSLSSLKAVSLAGNALNGSLTNDGLCDLKNLQELDLRYNKFDGNLPECFNRLSSLKLFDISLNQFTGILLPSLIINLTLLEYVDFSHNKFEGSFSFSSFSNHTKLEFFRFQTDAAQLAVETEEPIGWIPMFQLKFLWLSNCNLKGPKGSAVPGFLLHQHKLQLLDLSHNSLEGDFPNWLLKNNTNLEFLKLRSNYFGSVLHMGYESTNLKELDVSGNQMTGTIPENIHNFIPYIVYLNFSSNALNGVIPTSIEHLSGLFVLDFSNNKLSGEVPKGLLANLPNLRVLKLSNNTLSGRVLSGNLSLGIESLQLNDNCFTGNIGNNSIEYMPYLLDISDNHFTGRIPSWMSNMRGVPSGWDLLVRNNLLEGQFPCGEASFFFLDISQNSFSGHIPSCLNLSDIKHLHLGSNRFSGQVPDTFRSLTNVLTLDISHNYLSGRIPEFLGELSNLRILLLGNNKFVGSIPEQLCQLNNVSLIDVSSNSLTGSIPRCLQNITGPKKLAFIPEDLLTYSGPTFDFGSLIPHIIYIRYFDSSKTRDEVQFTTKNNPLTYKGNILDYMSGLDLSCNKLSGEIPEELGMLTQILALNLSHNQLTGPIPVNVSNLAKLESLDLSSNKLSGAVPSELIKLTSLAVFDVSHNNLSGRLPERKAQFGTFSKESYEGNPFLCGPPLENKCGTAPQVSDSSTKEGNEKWYDIDKGSFYGSSGSAWFLFMLGFAAVLIINPYWRRRWLQFVEECMYTCYYFIYDLVWNPYMIFHK